MLSIIRKEILQIRAFIILATVMLAFTTTACIHHCDLFRKFFGSPHPALVVCICSVVGLFSILMLLKVTPFRVLKRSPREGILWALLLALPFGAVIIVIDCLAPFPEDIALPFPESLLLYPSLGFVAEIIFHIVPFTLLVFVLTRLLKNAGSERVISISILVTAFLESIYHIVNMSGAVQFSNGILLLVGFHIFLISLCQLTLFRRHDFVTMFSFRMAYYLIWHIAWGSIRLDVLY